MCSNWEYKEAPISLFEKTKCAIALHDMTDRELWWEDKQAVSVVKSMLT